MQENQMQDLNQGPPGIQYPDSGPPGVQYPSDPQVGRDSTANLMRNPQQTGPEMVNPQFVQQQPGMVYQQPGMVQQQPVIIQQQPGMVQMQLGQAGFSSQPGVQQPNQVVPMQMQPGQFPGMQPEQMPMQNMQPGQFSGMQMQTGGVQLTKMQLGQVPGMQQQPGQVPGYQMQQPGQVPGMQMQQPYQMQQPSYPARFSQPNPQIQMKAPASTSEHDILAQVYVYDVMTQARWIWPIFCVLTCLEMALIFGIFDTALEYSDVKLIVTISGFFLGILQIAAIFKVFFNPEKVTVRFCKSLDSVDITYYYKMNRSTKDNLKLSDMIDVFTTEQWAKPKDEAPYLVGHFVHLNWKQGADTEFHLPMPNETHNAKAQEINQFVFGGEARMRKKTRLTFDCCDWSNCLTCGGGCCKFFPAAIVMGAINAELFIFILDSVIGKSPNKTDTRQ